MSLRIIALGHFSDAIPPLASLEIPLHRCTDMEQLPVTADIQDILLTDFHWLNTLSPSVRDDLIRYAKQCTGWIMLSDRETRLKDQLAWRRQGVSHFFAKPLDTERLAALTEDLLDRINGPAVRVILVDDEKSLLAYYGAVLRQAGMNVMSIQDPLTLMESLDEHKPDVIVLDIEMPACRGYELVAILRQQPAYAKLPIIFMSGATGIEELLQAHAEAADDFLTKPVPLELLQSTVRAQAWRHRALLRTEAKAHASHQRLEQLRWALDEHAIVSIAGADGNIQHVNDKFCALSGYMRQELIGRNHRIVKSAQHAAEFYEAIWSKIYAGKTWHGEICNRRKNGELYWVEGSIVPFLDANGLPVQYISIRTDITALKQREMQLTENRERLKFAVEGAGDGIWDWDIATGEMQFSGYYEEMLGYAKGELEPTIDAWIKSVYPADLARVEQTLHDYLAEKIPSYTVELRLACKDGSHKWVLCRGNLVSRDTNKRPKRMIGIHSDISLRKQSERMIDYLQAAIETISDGFVIHDENDRFVLANAKYREYYHLNTDILVPGIPFEELLRYGMQNGQYPEAIGREEAWLAERLYAHRNPGKPIEQQLPDGKWLRIAEYRMTDGSIAGLRSDITDLKQVEAALRIAKETADRANQAKSDFLSSMSHELRTPMNAIIGFAQMLEYDEALNADQQDSVQEISKAGRHLLELINEVLDLAKIESGRIELSMEAVALAPLCEDCRHLVAPQATLRNITFESYLPTEAAVFADRVRLKQVLLNLLSNAVKYNRPSGKVCLKVEPGTAGHWRITVADTGHGIAADRMDDLFQPFNRLDAEYSDIEGTGIGLTITRRLVDLMGGTLGVESEVGVGSSFWLELLTENQKIVGAGGTAVNESTATSDQWQAVTVLAIDDNPANLKLIAQVMGMRENVHLITAHEPGLGIEQALAHRPDLILLDINMPGMDGYQVLDILKADTNLCAIPVIAITANAMPRDIERGMTAGFANYLTKPLEIDRFLQAVSAVLSQPNCGG